MNIQSYRNEKNSLLKSNCLLIFLIFLGTIGYVYDKNNDCYITSSATSYFCRTSILRFLFADQSEFCIKENSEDQEQVTLHFKLKTDFQRKDVINLISSKASDYL